MKMSDDEARSFAHYVCNLNESKKTGIRKICSINETGNSTTPVGDYPEHWVDNWHELEGGNGPYELQPQCGVKLLQAEMNGLSYRNGYETARDDASKLIWFLSWCMKPGAWRGSISSHWVCMIEFLDHTNWPQGGGDHWSAMG